MHLTSPTTSCDLSLNPRSCVGFTRHAAWRVQAAAAAPARSEKQQYKVVGQRELCKAYKGRAVELQKGQFIKVINTPGTQVWSKSYSSLLSSVSIYSLNPNPPPKP